MTAAKVSGDFRQELSAVTSAQRLASDVHHSYPDSYRIRQNDIGSLLPTFVDRLFCCTY